jgi:hypothetical protein
MTDLKKLLERARDQAGHGEATFWKPTAAGDHIAGEIIKIVTGGRFNSTNYTLRTDNGTVIVSASPETVLGRELRHHNLTVGDSIAIVFVGEKKAKTGKTYKAWSIIVEKAEKTAVGDDDSDDMSF